MCSQTANYMIFPFAQPQMAERYIAYAALHPDMAADEVVWRVNNHLDRPPYEHVAEIESCDDLLVIVNKHFKLPDDYAPTDLVEVDGRMMRAITAQAYVTMRDAAAADGLSVSVSNSYRSLADQQTVYKKRIRLDGSAEKADKTCARPGHSEHHTGLAIDVQGSIRGGRNIDKTPEGPWVRDNCHKFGFILRYTPEIVEITGYASEPWHLRYVGTEVSTDMKKRNIPSFEEYRERFLKTR